MADCIATLRTGIADYEDALRRRKDDPGIVLPERPWRIYVRLTGELQAVVDGHNDELRTLSPNDVDLEVTRSVVDRRTRCYLAVRELARQAIAHGD